MNDISRRTVAKGAAWAVPAVSVAAGAPAFASSPIPCPAQSCFYNVASAPTYNVTQGDTNLTLCNTILGVKYYTKSSFVALTFGDYAINRSCNMPSNALYFVFQATSITAVDNTGTTHVGTITNQCGSGNASSCGALGVYSGGSIGLSVQFRDFEGYNTCTLSNTWSSTHYLKSYTVNYTLLFRDAGGNALTTVPANCTYSATFTASTPTLQGGTLTGSL